MQAKYPMFLKTGVSLKLALKIKEIANRKGISISALLRETIEKYLELNQ